MSRIRGRMVEYGIRTKEMLDKPGRPKRLDYCRFANMIRGRIKTLSDEEYRWLAKQLERTGLTEQDIRDDVAAVVARRCARELV